MNRTKHLGFLALALLALAACGDARAPVAADAATHAMPRNGRGEGAGTGAAASRLSAWAAASASSCRLRWADSVIASAVTAALATASCSPKFLAYMIVVTSRISVVMTKPMSQKCTAPGLLDGEAAMGFRLQKDLPEPDRTC